MNSENNCSETIEESRDCSDCTSEIFEEPKACKKFKWISPSLFASIVILFFMPFTELKCSGKTIAKIKGIELITGKKLEVSKIKSNFLAAIPFASAIIALLLLVLLPQKRNYIMILSLVGFVSFVFLFYSINKNSGRGCVDIHFTNYFWAVFLLYFASGLYEVVCFRRGLKMRCSCQI